MTKRQTTQKWSTVIDAVLHHDKREGTYSLRVYNADDTLAGALDINAVSIRPAMLEATALLEVSGYKPATRWVGDKTSGGTGTANMRRFRKAVK